MLFKKKNYREVELYYKINSIDLDNFFKEFEETIEENINESSQVLGFEYSANNQEIKIK